MPQLGLEETYARIGDSAAHDIVAADVVSVTGPDASSWLQGQLSQDLDAVEVGGSTLSLVLSPQGRIDSVVSAVRATDGTWRLVTRAGFGEALFERLRRFRLRVKADLSLESKALAVVRGPDPGPLAGELAAVAEPLAEVAVSWPGWSGIDLLLDSPDRARAVAPSGVRAGFEARRIEAGVPELGREVTERTIPHEAGRLVEMSVSFTKGCYTGQELVARVDARGANVPRRLRRIDVPGEPFMSPPVQAGDKLVLDGTAVGEVTSAAWSPGAGGYVALGYLKRAVTVPAEVELARADGSAPLPGRAVALPGA